MTLGLGRNGASANATQLRAIVTKTQASLVHHQKRGRTDFLTLSGWGTDHRHLDPNLHVVGKWRTQQLERKHLTLRARIKRLARKPIYFSKPFQMHGLIIGLFINRFEFGAAV